MSQTMDEVLERRLTDTTYTLDEVKTIFSELNETLKSLFDNDLITTSHANVLLLQQYFAQADSWKLVLKANMGELENRQMLKAIADFEKNVFSPSAKKDTGKLGDIAPTGYLQTELSKVSAENANLKTQLEAGATNMGQELRRKDSLIQSLEMKLRDMESEMGRLRIAEKSAQQTSSSPSPPPTSDNTNSSSNKSTSAFSKLLPSLRSNSQTTNDTDNTNDSLRQAQQEIQTLKQKVQELDKELNTKISMSKPVQNMQKMLMKKNAVIKDYRKRLGQFDPSVLVEDGADDGADDS